MTPVVPGAPIAEAVRDAYLGRLAFVTVFDDLKEVLGDGLEVVGPVVVPGDRRARAFNVNLPVHSHPADTSSENAAERLRRQLRALLNNQKACAEGLYFRLDFDPDQNGWLRVGGGELEYDEGGTTLSDYKLALSDCYRVASPRTHRPARTLLKRDRRESTVTRDILGTVYSTDFAAQTALAEHALPVGASGVVGLSQVPLTAATRAGIDGAIPLLTARTHREVVSFDHEEADHGKGDVIALDRKGLTVPSYTLAGDAAPQATYGWEELCGPDQELTDGDVPALQNGLCRIRYVAATKTFAIDAYVAGTGYVEQGRVGLWRDSPAGTETQYATLQSAQLVEWTPERAVVKAVFGISTTDRCECFITLQRGWTGPRFEAYGYWSSAARPGVAIRVVPYTAAATRLERSSGATDPVVDTTDYGTFAALVPWASLLGQSPNLGLHLAVLQGALKTVGRADTVAYGATRNGVSLVAPVGGAIAGYVSATLGVGPRASVVADATALGQTNLLDARSIPEIVERS